MAFAETAAGTTQLGNYTSSYSCTVDGSATGGTSGSGTGGQLTIPTTGQNIVCTITNVAIPPATITLQKEMVGPRAKSTDQVTISLSRSQSGASTLQGSATTTGTAAGIQSAKVGPITAVRGGTYTFTESASAGTNLADYDYLYSCTVDGTPLAHTVTADGHGSVTIPSTGSSIVCTISNAQVTHVTVTKTVQDYAGQNPRPGQGWTITGQLAATTGSATATPSATTQTTDAQGQARWNVSFGSNTARATVTVAETQQAGYSFVTGTCRVTEADGVSQRTITLTGAAATAIPNVARGEQVACNYVNKVIPSQLTLQKSLDTRYDPDAGAAQWTLSAAGPSPITGVTGASAVTQAAVAPGDYSLSEALRAVDANKLSGYQAVRLVCTDASTGVISTVTLANPKITLAPGQNVTCVFTNQDLPGAVQWRKTDADTGAALAGSTWTLTGPSHPQGLTVSGSSTGVFSQGGLRWGQYQLVEKTAPAGYRLSSQVRTFTVGPQSPAQMTVDLGALTNSAQSALRLPLTGGIGSQLYWILGGALAAAAVITALTKSRRGAAANRD